ncbi:MAG TPA: DUF2950 domain-containing protein [Syntrophales bacterium]|nr:DUF2950 domain-containing protein [Syntrophales bacterium]
MTLYIHREKKVLPGWRVPLVIAAAMLFVVFAGDFSYGAKSIGKMFKSPDEAFTAMVNALKDSNDKQLAAIFGPDSKKLFPMLEGTEGETCGHFLQAYEEKKRIEMVGDKKAVLHVGEKDWPWPIPVVKKGQWWQFDTQEGKKEILARRIGRNETSAVQVSLAYVDAQHEYARDHHTAKGLSEYAQKFASDDGKKNGLCWEVKEGEKQSPLGPEVASACKVSYSGSGYPKPYHGYFYKILTKQGLNAPGGEYDYVVDGRMVGGFALVAYPASYGSTGIMTFIVNQDGVVYQKNLGKDTAKRAEAMTGFDPDKTWTKVD